LESCCCPMSVVKRFESEIVEFTTGLIILKADTYCDTRLHDDLASCT
jgi:hypothetical protein